MILHGNCDPLFEQRVSCNLGVKCMNGNEFDEAEQAWAYTDGNKARDSEQKQKSTNILVLFMVQCRAELQQALFSTLPDI